MNDNRWRVAEWILRVVVAGLIGFAGWGFREVYALRAEVIRSQVKLEAVTIESASTRSSLEALRDTGTKRLAFHEGTDDQRFADLKEDVLRRLGNIESKLDKLVSRP